MTTFLFAYRAPEGYTPGQPDAVAAWRAWFEEINEHVEELGNPIFARDSVGKPLGETVLGGYSFIAAESLDEAVSLARGCPLIALGGGVEVGVVTPLDRDQMTAVAAGRTAAASGTI
jgi:hypothetical protein